MSVYCMTQIDGRDDRMMSTPCRRHSESPPVICENVTSSRTHRSSAQSCSSQSIVHSTASHSHVAHGCSPSCCRYHVHVDSFDHLQIPLDEPSAGVLPYPYTGVFNRLKFMHCRPRRQCSRANKTNSRRRPCSRPWLPASLRMHCSETGVELEIGRMAAGLV